VFEIELDNRFKVIDVEGSYMKQYDLQTNPVDEVLLKLFLL